MAWYSSKDSKWDVAKTKAGKSGGFTWERQAEADEAM